MSTHAEKDQNPLGIITNYVGELTYNSLDNTLESRFSLMFEELLLPDTSFRNKDTNKVMRSVSMEIFSLITNENQS